MFGVTEVLIPRGPVKQRSFGACLGVIALALGVRAQVQPTPETTVNAGRQRPPDPTSEYRATIDQYCVTCHNQRLKTGGLTLDTLDLTKIADRADLWEKVVQKLSAGAMPPQGVKRPDVGTYHALTAWLEAELDRAAAANPNPG